MIATIQEPVNSPAAKKPQCVCPKRRHILNHSTKDETKYSSFWGGCGSWACAECSKDLAIGWASQITLTCKSELAWDKDLYVMTCRKSDWATIRDGITRKGGSAYRHTTGGVVMFITTVAMPGAVPLGEDGLNNVVAQMVDDVVLGKGKQFARCGAWKSPPKNKPSKDWELVGTGRATPERSEAVAADHGVEVKKKHWNSTTPTLDYQTPIDWTEQDRRHWLSGMGISRRARRKTIDTVCSIPIRDCADTVMPPGQRRAAA